MTDKNIQIDFTKNNGKYRVRCEFPEDGCYAFVEDMSKDGLKNFRNMIHNLLIELNMELNYE